MNLKKTKIILLFIKIIILKKIKILFSQEHKSLNIMLYKFCRYFHSLIYNISKIF